MGSFTELSLSFHLRSDVAPEVLATFAALAEPSADAPALLGPTEEPSPSWAPDEPGLAPDPLADEPWRHHWAPWLGAGMGVMTVPHAALRWNRSLGLWHLGFRCSWKSDPVTAVAAVGWMGQLVDTTYTAAGRPVFVGTAMWEAWGPFLVWLRDGRLVGDGLGPDDPPFDMDRP